MRVVKEVVDRPCRYVNRDLHRVYNTPLPTAFRQEFVISSSNSLSNTCTHRSILKMVAKTQSIEQRCTVESSAKAVSWQPSSGPLGSFLLQ